jgi:hypothetical protein
MDRNITIFSLSLFLLFVLILGACSPGSENIPTPTASILESEDESAEKQASTVLETQAPPPEAEAASPDKPTPKQGLVASDPTTVNIASGEPVLVEFFAFW